MAIATITKHDLVNIGFGDLDLRLAVGDDRFSEGGVRELLRRLFDYSPSWQILALRYAFDKNCLEVQIASPEFEPHATGHALMYLPRMNELLD